MDLIYLLLIGAIALPSLWGVTIWLEAQSFKKRLYGLGHLTGSTKDEIILAIGPPNSFSSIDDGRDLLQWQRPGYHIALSFKDGICEGATHEYKAH